LVFVLGNLCNFAAFNFAAQSLLAPLGSFSLVVNVIVAPLLNSEVWTWKDIVGVLLIIAGSTIVVIFAGFPPKDYNLCVLLKLFRQPATVAFLVVTCSLIGMIFFTILFVEKNLDLKEASAVVIEQTLQEGKLVDVQTNPHAGAPANDITVTEEKTDKGFKRIVTIPSKPKLRKKNDDSDNSDDEIQVEQPHHPIVDIDGVPVEEFLKAKTTTGSVHSLALTFELENSEVDADKTSVDGAASMEEAKEKVVVLPRKTAESKPNRFVEFTKRWVFFQKLYSIQWVPRIKEPIPLDSFIVRYILPIAYASIGVILFYIGIDGYHDCPVCQSNDSFNRTNLVSKQ
jgi:hypothetical protein